MAKSKPRSGRGKGIGPIDVHVGARVQQRRTLFGEHFFEDIPAAVAASSPAAQKSGRAKEPPSYEPNPMHRRETLELVRAYYKIQDTDVRKRVYQLIKGVGDAGV